MWARNIAPAAYNSSMAFDFQDNLAITLDPPVEYWTLCITGDKGPMVSIRTDGTIEYGPNYVPDEAAKIFWEAVSHNRPYDPKALISFLPYQDPADQFWETERPS